MSQAERRTLARIHRAAIALLRGLRVVDDASGLTGPRLSALSVVVFGGPVTLGQLARAERVTPPTMSRIVDALVAAGLVARRPDPRDRRVAWIRPTRAGRRLMSAGRDRRLRALRSAASHMTAGERERLPAVADALEALTRGLDGA